MGLRGPRPKSVEEHILHGYYRPSRHGPRPAPEKTEEEKRVDEAWALLRLPVPPVRELDPIEELLRRDGIEILPEDRRPKRDGG